MELDDDSTKVVHRTEGAGKSNYWVVLLVLVLWGISVGFYLPGMP